MDVLRIILLIAHFVGLAMLLGGFLVQQKAIAGGEGRVLPIMWRGALVQLVTGLLLVGVIEMGGLFELDNGRIAVKLIVALAVAVLAFLYRRKDPAPSWALWTIGTLTLANIVVAVAWP